MPHNISNFKSLAFFQFHFIRVILIALISLIFVHLLVYNKLPGDENYTFPIDQLAIVFLFGFTVCTFNWVVYYFFKISSDHSVKRQIVYKTLLHTVSSLIAYSSLYFFLLYAVFSTTHFSWANFLKGFQMCFMVVLIEFLLIELLNLSNKPLISKSKLSKLIVKSGSKLFQVTNEEIALFHSQSGIVTMQLKNKSKFITDFNSLEELEEKLPEQNFFRVSRQFLLSKDAVKSVSKDRNRKLLIHLNSEVCNGMTTNITVSRYKSTNFKNWFKHE